MDGDFLSHIEIFSSLPSEQRRAIARHCRPLRRRRGQPVFRQREHAVRHVYFVVSGMLRVTLLASDGREVPFEDLAAGQMFGELAAIDGLPRTTGVVALTDVTLAYVDAEQFWFLLRGHNDVCAAVLRRLSSIIRRLCERVFTISARNVRSRVHAELLRLAGEHRAPDDANSAPNCPLPSHRAMAGHIGTAREVVTREIGDLQRRGLVKQRRARKLLSVPDIARLAEYAYSMEQGALAGDGGG